MDLSVHCILEQSQATLTHNVEKAFENHDVLTSLAFDIKGEFDRVSKNG